MQSNLFSKDLNFYPSYLFSIVKEGDVFEIGDKQLEIVRAKKSKLSKMEFCNISSDEIINENVTVRYGLDKFILKYLYGSYHSNIKNMSKRKDDKAAGLYRDIESILIVDSINQFNPFHEKSTILKYLEENFSDFK